MHNATELTEKAMQLLKDLVDAVDDYCFPIDTKARIDELLEQYEAQRYE
jgi:hypothetical protein